MCRGKTGLLRPITGADVSHPGPGVLRPSVAAVVSSVDERAARYVAKCAVQGPRTEIIEDLESLIDVGSNSMEFDGPPKSDRSDRTR